MPPAPREVTADPRRYSRTRSSPTTFGPVGRVIATVVIVGPAVVMALLPGMAGVAGAAMWTVLIVPWGLRDVWRRGRLR